MTNKEQIEEMASKIQLFREGICLDGVEGWVRSTPWQIAEDLYNVGYQKVGKDEIVISKKEYTFVNKKFILNKSKFINVVGLKRGWIYEVMHNNIIEIIVKIDDIK